MNDHNTITAFLELTSRTMAATVGRWSDETRLALVSVAENIVSPPKGMEDNLPPMVDFRILRAENKAALAIMVDTMAVARQVSLQKSRERLAEYFAMVESGHEYTTYHTVKDQLEALLTTDNVDPRDTEKLVHMAMDLRADPAITGEALDDLIRRGFVTAEVLASQPESIQMVLWDGIIRTTK